MSLIDRLFTGSGIASSRVFQPSGVQAFLAGPSGPDLSFEYSTIGGASGELTDGVTIALEEIMFGEFQVHVTNAGSSTQLTDVAITGSSTGPSTPQDVDNGTTLLSFTLADTEGLPSSESITLTFADGTEISFEINYTLDGGGRL